MDKITRLLKALMFAPLRDGGGAPYWGLPAVFYGEPGVGKSQILGAFWRGTGLPLEVLKPGERGEGQFGVVPVPTADGYLSYPAPDWVRKFDEAGAGLVFCDEFNRGERLIQSAMLGLIDFPHTIGTKSLPNRVRVVGAANKSADCQDLIPALRNRAAHLDWPTPSPDEWTDFILSAGSAAGPSPVAPLNVESEESRVLEAWAAPYATAAGLVTAFVRSSVGRKHYNGQPASEADSFASCRSLEYAIRALASAEIQGLPETEALELFGGFVGQPCAVAFAGFRREADIPSPEDVLDGKVVFTHRSERPDRTCAVLSACASLLAAPVKGKDAASLRKARAGVLWTLTGTVLDTDADATVPAGRTLVKAGLGYGAVPEAAKVLSRLEPFLKLAGVK